MQSTTLRSSRVRWGRARLHAAPSYADHAPSTPCPVPCQYQRLSAGCALRVKPELDLRQPYEGGYRDMLLRRTFPHHDHLGSASALGRTSVAYLPSPATLDIC